MTLIEGIGDEVIHFFLLLAIAFITLVAWWSTNLSERPLIRTVFIVERRTIRRAPIDTQRVTTDVTETNDILPEGSEIAEENKSSQPVTNADNRVEVNDFQQNGDGDGDNAPNAEPASDIDMPNEIAGSHSNEESNNWEGTDESVIRNRRLAFFESRQEQRSGAEESERGQNVDAEDNDTSPGECETENSDEGNIRIRLKYLNDDQKLVEGKLQEQLGEFKRRHFSLELAGRKLVRLIFQGQVLIEDTKTLQNCGFFDNCVVHCVVQSRSPPPSPNLNRPRNETQIHNDTSENWHFGNILFISVSLILCFAWYGRYQYAHLYNASTTVGLVTLTAILTVFLIGVYVPDTDGVRI